MHSHKKGGFTLVELIVVITILAILGTIAFLSIQGYSANARDSKRVSDVSNIKKSLEFFILNSEKYPMPDEVGAASYSGSDIYYQGKIGDNVTQNLSRNLKNVPRDPLTEETYIYSVTRNQQQYELTVVYENSVGYHQLIGDTYADLSDGVVSVDGNYNGLYVQTDTFAFPLPSITTSEELPLVFDSTNIQSQIVSGGANKPSIGGLSAQTGGLDINLSVYDGKVDVTSSNTEKIAFIQAIQGAYAGSSLAQGGSIYEEITSKTSDADLVAFANGAIASSDGEAVPEVLQCPEGQELSGEVCAVTSVTDAGGTLVFHLDATDLDGDGNEDSAAVINHAITNNTWTSKVGNVTFTKDAGSGDISQVTFGTGTTNKGIEFNNSKLSATSTGIGSVTERSLYVVAQFNPLAYVGHAGIWPLQFGGIYFRQRAAYEAPNLEMHIEGYNSIYVTPSPGDYHNFSPSPIILSIKQDSTGNALVGENSNTIYTGIKTGVNTVVNAMNEIRLTSYSTFSADNYIYDGLVLGEVLIYDKNTTSSEHTEIVDFLKAKWGIN